MYFGGLQKLTLIDYPGKLAATIFTLGCNFRCPYCHNPELVLPALIEKQPKISEEEVLNFLKERKGLLEGLCLTGGEPLLYPELKDFIKKVKALGYFIKLDTNGSFPEYLKDLIKEKLIDYAAMDIKAPKEKYHLFTLNKVPLEKINRTIEIIKEGKIDYEFRTTLTPELLTEEDILKIGEWLKPAKKYFLQQFKAIKTLDKDFLKKKPWPEDKVLALKEKLKPYFEICEIR